MQDQNFKNHVRAVALYHFVLLTVVLAVDILAIIHLISAFRHDRGILTAFIFVLTAIALSIISILIRTFPLVAQDRAIRAEENLRYFVLTGKLLNSGLSIQQIIALRFAPDNEFVLLADRAVKEKLSNGDIKRAIRQWKADHHRV
ncbi:MAG: DUF6526 family protein [Bacteroidota bacterium]|nr:DUF6526 family protein [Bacteroidota bacterium]MDP4251288.1 DUF6526 family protein [Bacteroidota bacterium]